MYKECYLKMYITVSRVSMTFPRKKSTGRQISDEIESVVTKKLCMSSKCPSKISKFSLIWGGVFIKSFFENVNFLLNMGGGIY